MCVYVYLIKIYSLYFENWNCLLEMCECRNIFVFDFLCPLYALCVWLYGSILLQCNIQWHSDDMNVSHVFFTAVCLYYSNNETCKRHNTQKQTHHRRRETYDLSRDACSFRVRGFIFQCIHRSSTDSIPFIRVIHSTKV